MRLNEYAAGMAKKLRKERKISLEKMGEALGYKSSHSYFNLEHGKKAITLDELEKLCEFFNVKIAIFFEQRLDRVVIKNKKKSGQLTAGKVDGA